MESILYNKYKKEAVPALKEKFGYKNVMAVPRLTKVIINVGINARHNDSSLLENVEKNLTRIAGQNPVRTKAKKAISAFKIREGMVVGVKVTLRGQRMYDFLDKLINAALPRVRDFRGINPKNISNTGKLSLGFKEYNVFPEIKMDEIEKMHGLEVVIDNTASTKEEGLALFTQLGFPFQKK